MPFCAAFGYMYNSRYKTDSGVSMFRFPKEGRIIYCSLEDFSPTENNRFLGDAEKLKENGYAEPRIRLRKNAFPDY